MGTGYFGLLAFELLFGLGEAAAPAADPAARQRVGLEALVLAHSERAKLSPRLVKSVIAVESEFKPGAVSPRGARGLMQVMPATAEEFGVPARLLGTRDSNLRAGTTYLSYLYRALRTRYGLRAARLHEAPDWAQHRVLAAYNGGPRLLFQDRWPGETRRYVHRVARLAGLEPPRLPESPASAPAPAVLEDTWDLEM